MTAGRTNHSLFASGQMTAMSLSVCEISAIINNPRGLRLLMESEDCRYTQAEAVFGPEIMGPWPSKRYLELKARGRAIIEQDTDIWEDTILAFFGVARKPEPK